MSSPNGSHEQPPLRIGTKEREAAYAALNAHLDAGRLDVDEYGDRYAKASLARTQPELEALFADLPAPHPTFGDPPPAPSWASGPPRRPHPLRLMPAAFALIPILGVVLALSTGLWFLLFLVPFGASLFGRGFGYRGRSHAPGGRYGRPGGW